jgi:hypothetical protein
MSEPVVLHHGRELGDGWSRRGAAFCCNGLLGSRSAPRPILGPPLEMGDSYNLDFFGGNLTIDNGIGEASTMTRRVPRNAPALWILETR